MTGASVKNLIDFGFGGRIYPVTPHHPEILGLRCTADLDAIPDPIDTAVLVVRAERVLEWLPRCAARGIGSATIVGAGFSEGAAGSEGAEMTERLLAVARETGIRLLGPNTAGLINLRHHYAPRAAFNQFPAAETIVGNTAVICQSGAISNILYNKCQANGVGIAYSVATGDQVDLDVWDFVDFALDDDAVSQILCVVEGYRRAERFVSVANKAAALRKPVVILKLGRSTAGARMVETHSGSMAGASRVFSAVAKQAGLIEAVDFDQFWELAALFGHWGTRPAPSQAAQAEPAPPGAGARLGVFAISGGDAAFTADEAEATTLSLPPTRPEFDAAIAAEFSFASGNNPFDCTGEVLGRPELLERSASAFVTRNDFDAHLFAVPVFKSEIASNLYPRLLAGLAAAREDCNEPRIAISAWAAGSLTEHGIALLRQSGEPVFEHCGRAVRAIDAHDRWTRIRPMPIELVFPRPAQRPDPFYGDLKRELCAAGIPFEEDIVLHKGADDIPVGAFDGGCRYVLKQNVRSRVHKSAAGVVRIGLATAAAVADAIATMPLDQEHQGWILERQLRADLELYVGGNTDPDFGKLMLVGYGGRFAEALGGSDLRVGRLPDAAVESWLAATPAGRALRALDPARFDDLVRCVVAAARWFHAAEDVRAFDLNPVLVDLAERRLRAVDCRIA